MNIYIGIDGGGTKTQLVIIDESNNVLHFGHGGPSSIDTVTFEESTNAIRDSLNGFNFHPVKPNVRSVFLGIGGVNDYNAESFKSYIKDSKIFDEFTKIIVDNDVSNALFTSLTYDKCMVVISGTGSVVYGINGVLKHRAGGWGYHEGDGGSAYSIGRDALKLIAKVLDKRTQTSSLTTELMTSLNCNNPNDYILLIKSLYYNRNKTAQIARIVTKHANFGDNDAIFMLNTAIDDLILSVKTVYRELKLKRCTLTLVGSLANSGGYFESELVRLINLQFPLIDVIKPKVTPEMAAALLAKQLNH